MSDIIRPRFKYHLNTSPEAIRDRIIEAFKRSAEHPFTGSALHYHVNIDFKEKYRHFWSPHLDLNMEPTDEGVLIRGLIGPRPNVWTILMFANAVAGFLSIIGLVVGLSQWSIDQNPYALWMVCAGLVLFIIVFFIAKAGKKLAHPDSIKLKSFFEEQINTFQKLNLPEN